MAVSRASPPSLSSWAMIAAERWPNAVALRFNGETMTYAQLDIAANRVAHGLIKLGVRPGDRVGLWLDKSEKAVILMQGVLRSGAAYVPLDRQSPWRRISTIVSDAGIEVLAVDALGEAEIVRNAHAVRRLVIDDAHFTPPQTKRLHWSDLERLSAEPPQTASLQSGDDLAYILYTSGTTGRPKGVCISHRNAAAFVQWAAETLELLPHDRLGNHAPFHFDLSVFDIYAAFFSGARLCIPSKAEAFSPQSLVGFMHHEELTVWYSVPSILMLMMNHGGLLENPPASLRALLFAGEVFPIDDLKRLRSCLPTLQMWNYYGPTETNVCTAWPVPEDLSSYLRPIPIGRASAGNEVWMGDETGQPLAPGASGELWVQGPTVMLGYWGQPMQENRPYPTGDLVRQNAEGDYVFVGRKDNLVKINGHRVELEEIEAALSEHEGVKEVAVVLQTGKKLRLVAFIVGQVETIPGLLALKTHCAERLPRYMIIDRIRRLDALPRTGNGKVDRIALQSMVKQA